MITIICTTPRPESNTLKLSSVYQDVLSLMHIDCQLLDLGKVDAQWIEQSSFGDNSPKFDAIVKRYIRPAKKLIFITPEYNGTFPGYLKYFIDACGHGDFSKKKIALMGLASGRGGNLRGLDHLTGILHYLGNEVYSKKVYLSQIDNALSAEGKLLNELVQKEIETQLEGFVNF